MPASLATLSAGALVLVLGAAIGGAALAAAKKDNAAAADCLQKASIQFSLDNAQCAAYPPSEALNYCLSQAALNYSLAVQKCSADSAAAGVRRQTRPLVGVDTIKP